MLFNAPRGGEILLVGSEWENSTLSFWVLGDSDAPLVPHSVMAFTTGERIPSNAGKYIGTLSMFEKVYHFFDGRVG